MLLILPFPAGATYRLLACLLTALTPLKKSLKYLTKVHVTTGLREIRKQNRIHLNHFSDSKRPHLWNAAAWVPQAYLMLIDWCQLDHEEDSTETSP